MKDSDIQSALAMRIRNGFQNVGRSATIVERELGVPLFVCGDPVTPQKLVRTFEKRHPITHNLGIVDRKYLENAMSDEMEGREIRVTSNEVGEALALSLEILKTLHSRLFPREMMETAPNHQ